MTLTENRLRSGIEQAPLPGSELPISQKVNCYLFWVLYFWILNYHELGIKWFGMPCFRIPKTPRFQQAHADERHTRRNVSQRGFPRMETHGELSASARPILTFRFLGLTDPVRLSLHSVMLFIQNADYFLMFVLLKVIKQQMKIVA